MKRLVFLSGAGLVMLFTALSTFALDAEEEALKAAYIYNLLKFIELPRATQDSNLPTLRLCLLGASENQGRALRALVGRTAQGRSITVAEYGTTGCHVVYAGNEVGGARMRALAEQGLLTIDGADAIDNDGMVGLVNVDRRIRFEFNLISARRANIRIPAQLLKLATRVKAD
jgi:hypothetical protein